MVGARGVASQVGSARAGPPTYDLSWRDASPASRAHEGLRDRIAVRALLAAAGTFSITGGLRSSLARVAQSTPNRTQKIQDPVISAVMNRSVTTCPASAAINPARSHRSLGDPCRRRRQPANIARATTAM